MMGLAVWAAEVSTSNTTANIISAIAAVFTAFSLVITAVALLWKAVQTGRKVDKVKDQVGLVHTIVNQQRTDAQRYNIALTQLLKEHGIDVPVDQSLPVLGMPDAQPGQPK